MLFPSLPASMRKTTLCYGFRTRTVPNGYWWKCWCIRGKYGNRGSIPFFIQNVNDTNGANWVYISDWRHSCHLHSHISTLPIFQCNCQHEPVVHLQYRLRNWGSYSFYLAAHPSQSSFTAPLSPPQSAVPEPAYRYGNSNHCPSSPAPPWGEDNSQSNTATYGKDRKSVV